MSGDVFNGAVGAIYSFKGCMEQVTFGRSSLLRAPTFLEDLLEAFDF